VPINVFLSDELPKEKSNILSIITFCNKVDYKDRILSSGLVSENKSKKYEIWKVDEKVTQSKYQNINIVKNNSLLFGSVIFDNNKSYNHLSEQIQESYSNFHKIVNENKMQIVKIWHYIPELLKTYPDKKTNYSLLCKSREMIYKKYYQNQSYPAATVIGIEGKKILIYFFAVKCNFYKTIENKRQVSSYNYPQKIFQEKPMFSRAVEFSTNSLKNNKIVISGTASIIGYESMHNEDILSQLEESIKNYKTFLEIDKNTSNICRVYISKKEKENFYLVNNKLENYLGIDQFILIYGDICRSELLIEIEGISDVKKTI
tara:strand:- start:114 stop:1064 length:951 start_codon:yes stop_codon:yes gene_type:complete